MQLKEKTQVLPDFMDQGNKENQFVRFFCDKEYRWLRHLVPIVLMTICINTDEFKESWSLLVRLMVVTYLLLIPYVTIYLLLPLFLFKQRYEWFAGGAVVLIFLSLGVVKVFEPFLSRIQKDGHHFEDYSVSDIVSFCVIMTILLMASAGVKLFQQWVKTTYQQTMAENMAFQIELENLKKQLTPHFFFNTFNNLDALIYADQDKASELVHRFSGLLRYLLHNGTDVMVALDKEIGFINDYLYLETIRHDHFVFSVKKQGPLFQTYIQPWILIPFVENAVKHNNYSGKPFVEISFEARGDFFIFECSNPFPAIGKVQPGGTGLQNVKRRLDLLYPKKYELNMEKQNGLYHVKLVLSK